MPSAIALPTNPRRRCHVHKFGGSSLADAAQYRARSAACSAMAPARARGGGLGDAGHHRCAGRADRRPRARGGLGAGLGQLARSGTCDAAAALDGDGAPACTTHSPTTSSVAPRSRRAGQTARRTATHQRTRARPRRSLVLAPDARRARRRRRAAGSASMHARCWSCIPAKWAWASTGTTAARASRDGARGIPARDVVVTGFVARDAQGRATTLGRNGSDYSGGDLRQPVRRRRADHLDRCRRRALGRSAPGARRRLPAVAVAMPKPASWPTSAPRCCIRRRWRRCSRAASRCASATRVGPQAPGTLIDARDAIRDGAPVKGLSLVRRPGRAGTGRQRHGRRARHRRAPVRARCAAPACR